VAQPKNIIIYIFKTQNITRKTILKVQKLKSCNFK